MTTLVDPQQVSGGEHEHGHLEELRTDPIALSNRRKIMTKQAGTTTARRCWAATRFSDWPPHVIQ